MQDQEDVHPVFKKGITNSQINDLVRFTKTDKEVITQTHDPERFKSRETFGSWRSGKKIYTLSGPKGELFGIIWFKKMESPKIPADYTFAIRVYPPARGRGMAKDFMKKAFAEFGKAPIWLSTKRSNTKAVNLYRSFGFKKIKIADGRVYMVYTSRSLK